MDKRGCITPTPPTGPLHRGLEVPLLAVGIDPDIDARGRPPPKRGPDLHFLGADDGIRTRDPNLGKVVLYQLSHVRVGHESSANRCVRSRPGAPPPVRIARTGRRRTRRRRRPTPPGGPRGCRTRGRRCPTAPRPTPTPRS